MSVGELERLREQQRAISSVLRAVARLEGLQPVLDEVVAAATRLCAGNTGTLYVLEGELLHALSRSGAFETWEFDKNNPHRIDRIANARLLDRVERQRTELSRFVSPQVAELLSSDDGERLLAGHRAYITALFCDLRGFTAFAETAAPEELFELLRDYHALMGELIAAHEGTLEHFAGDGVMVFFNDPAPVPDHELQALRMGLVLQDRFGELAALWRRRGTELGLGIGIAAGYATLGRIGFEGVTTTARSGPSPTSPPGSAPRQRPARS